ncbi:hypothetical protein AX14_002881 [Amanita brunnescens Koide BX004]|nr:hypothetical protein AX14_002881 [Amanita brunnescens Koide BX004]
MVQRSRVHDDTQWFFLRDAATLLNARAPKSHLHLPSTLLSILVRLSTFPTEQSELNAWWVPELEAKTSETKIRQQDTITQ